MLCRAAQEWTHSGTHSGNSGSPWEGRTPDPVARLMLSPATSAPFPCLGGGTRIGYRSSSRVSTSVTLSTSQAAPTGPLAPTIFHPMPECLKDVGQGRETLSHERPGEGRAKCWSGLTICLPQGCQSGLCLKDKCKRKVNTVHPPQTAFLSAAFKAPLGCGHGRSSLVLGAHQLSFYYPFEDLPRGVISTLLPSVSIGLILLTLPDCSNVSTIGKSF